MQTYKIEIITWKIGMETCKNEKRYSININILRIHVTFAEFMLIISKQVGRERVNKYNYLWYSPTR